jgi:hypothetical protein
MKEIKHWVGFTKCQTSLSVPVLAVFQQDVSSSVSRFCQD